MNYLKLREKGEQDIVTLPDFPITIRTKPTAHIQYCFLCRKLVEKGTKQIMVGSGYWRCNNELTKGVSAGFKRMGGVPFPGKDKPYRLSTGIITPRYLYFHPHCFSCLTRRLFWKAGIQLAPNCDTCDKKFKCYTNSLPTHGGFVDETFKYPYMPSRQCGSWNES